MKLVHRGLEFLRGFLKILLALVPLLLQESEFAFPQCAVSIVIIDRVLELALHLGAFFAGTVQLLGDGLLVASEGF